VGLEINLQFTATSVEELKEQLKDALEALGGSEAQTPLEEKRWHKQQSLIPVEKKAEQTKAEKPSHSDTSQKKTKRGRPKKAPSKGPCKDCGTTTTPQWRRTTMPEGPLCNACHLRRVTAKKRAQKEASNETKETARQRSLRIRKDNMKKSAMPKTKTTKTTTTKNEPALVIPEKEEVEVSVDTFLVWGEKFIPGMIMRDKTFLIATKVIETWFTTLKSNHEYNSWLADNLEVYLEEMRKIFKEYEAAYPTVLMVQDAGDNVVLMVNNPRALTTKDLETVKWV
tara:strand:+ start:323 stop:1171 length:849 start_codon:yes stop_codon:yes gene_type:complete